MRRFCPSVFSFALVCLMAGYQVFAQTPNINSIKKQFNQSSTDTTQHRLALVLGKIYEENNLDSSLFFFGKSLEIAQKSKIPLLIAESMCEIGRANLYLIKDEAKAIEWLNKSLEISLKHKFYAISAVCYIYLGIIANHQNNASKFEFLKKSIELAKLSNDKKVIADSYSASHQIYFLSNRLKDSEFYLLKAIDIQKNNNIDNWFTYSLDYCDILEKQKKYDESYQYAQKLSKSVPKLQKSEGTFVYLNDNGRLQIKLRNYRQAEKYFYDAIEFEKSKTKPDTSHLNYSFTELENIYLIQQDYKKAHEISKKLMVIRLWLSQKRETQNSQILITQLKSKLDLEKKEIEIKRLADKQNQQFFLLIAFIAIMALLSSLIIILERNKKRIERQKEELSQINATKDKLFSIIAHDLRKPIASLKGILQLFDNQSLSQSEFVELSKQLEQNVDNIHAMLENLLLWSLSQMNGIKPHFRKFNIAETVTDTISLFGEMTRQKQVRLITNIDNQLVAFADENQIQTVIRNLLNNAVKFSPINGQVEILGYAEDKKISLTFTDSGSGIKPEELATIFSKPKLNLGTKGEKGTGLGLILCKELIEQNQGNISVSSQNGQGSTFKISLPIG